MDSVKYPTTDPAAILLNEIDILLAQTRLMELYLKRSQAIAENETARLHEQYQQEFALLRASLAEKERAFAISQTAVSEKEQVFLDRVGELENQLGEKQSLLESREAELNNSRSKIADLRGQIAELENARQRSQRAEAEASMARAALQVELASLRRQLEESHADSQAQQETSRELRERLESEISELRRQLQERQTHSQALASELEQARACFALELANLQSALASREEDFRHRENDFVQTERSLRTEILALRSQLEHRQELVEFRDEELRQGQDQLAALQQRIIELESSRDAMAVNTAELDSLRRSLESRIAAMQQEVVSKEEDLKQHHEAVTGRELALRGKIQSLQEELAHNRNRVAQTEAGLQSARAEAASLRSRVAELEAGVAAAKLAAGQLEEEKKRGAVLESELTRLHADLAHKDDALKEQEAFFRSAEVRLTGEIQQLRHDMAQRQTTVESAGAELARLQAETAMLQERNSALQALVRQAEENWRAATAAQQALTKGLEQKDIELSLAQTTAKELRSQCDGLQLELAEGGLLAQSRVMEIGNLKAELLRLSDQLIQQQSAAHRAQADLEGKLAARQAELAGLHQGQRDRQHGFASELTAEKQKVAELSRQLEEVQQRSAELETMLNSREQDAARLSHELGTLRSRAHDLDALRESEKAAVKNEAERARAQSEAELSALRIEFERKARVLTQQQADMENLTLTQLSQIQKLEAQLVEQQSSTEEGRLETERGRAQARLLQERLAELEGELQRVRQSGNLQAEQLRQSTTEIEELSGQLVQKSAEIEARAASQSAVQQSLRDEIERLIQEARERNQILQDRNDEVVRVKSEMDRLLDRLGLLESSVSQAEAAQVADSESMRADFQAQLALLQAELSQKEWALEERDATVRSLQQKYLDEIAALRQHLAEKEAAAGRVEPEFALGEPQMPRAQMDSFHFAEEANSPGHNNGSGHARRWHGGFGWKRRWKTEQSRGQ